MLTDRKYIQALLDELEENHSIKEFHLSSTEIQSSKSRSRDTDRPTPVKQHDGLTMSDTESVLERFTDDKETPWVNKEKFPNITLVNE